jgi:single-stranded-DNA-specific exonuclease
MNGLRLLCTNRPEKAQELARNLGGVNRERQQLTVDTTFHARSLVVEHTLDQKHKILIIADEIYNQGIIGLVAGRLVEEFALPAIVIARGQSISKASARSIPGFNIVEAIRTAHEFLLEVGGHPMAAGFSLKTEDIDQFTQILQRLAEESITDAMRQKMVQIDATIPVSLVSEELVDSIAQLAPFGFGNPEPIFCSTSVTLWEARKIGAEGKHIKCKISQDTKPISAVAFNMGPDFDRITAAKTVDVAYSVDINIWNGKKEVQMKVKDIIDRK